MKQKPEKPFPALLVGASGKYNLWNHVEGWGGISLYFKGGGMKNVWYGETYCQII